MDRSVKLTAVILGVPTVLLAVGLVVWDLARDNWEFKVGMKLDETLVPRQGFVLGMLVCIEPSKAAECRSPHPNL